MPSYARADHVVLGFLAETTEGTFKTGAYDPEFYTTWSPDSSSTITKDPTITGAGEPIDARTTLRGFTASLEFVLRHTNCRKMLAMALRDTLASAVTIVGSSDIDVVASGTHQDGTTGSQLSTATSGFNALKTYASAAAGGANGLMMAVTGSAQAANNKERRIKAVWNNGSVDLIDIEPGWTAGSGAWGGAVSGTTGESLTIKVGRAIRNRRFSFSVAPSHSAVWQFSDLNSGNSYQSATGLVGGDLTLNITGHEYQKATLAMVGYAMGEIVASNPSGSPFNALAANKRGMLSAQDLKVFAITPILAAGGGPIVLSAVDLTSATYNLKAAADPISNVAGTDTTSGITRGMHDPSGTLEIYHDHTVSILLSALGSSSGAKVAEIAWKTQDPDGNIMWCSGLRNEFSPLAAKPANPASNGTLTFEGYRSGGAGDPRSFIIQEFDA